MAPETSRQKWPLEKNKKFLKKVAILVDFYFSFAYTSASNLGKRVLKKSKRG